MVRWIRGWFERWRTNQGAPTHAGAAGELAAARWLERERGFRILTRNWRSPRDRRREIDIVAEHAGVLVFVEVKTRSSEALVPGYYAAVAPKKKKVLLLAARDYVQQLRTRPRTVRFDVVEVSSEPLADGAREIHHFEHVPLFPKEFLRGR